MDPFKIIGGLMILLGVIFRAICIANFNRLARKLPQDAKAQRQHAQSKQRALLIDYAFIGIGVYTLVTH